MSDPTPEPTSGERHFSVGEFIALPFVLAFLLFVISAHLHDVWGVIWSALFLIIVLGIAAASLWDLVRGSRSGEPEALPRWVTLAVLAGYGVVPLAGWYLVVLAQQPAGALVPFAPALVLAAFFGTAAARGRAGKR